MARLHILQQTSPNTYEVVVHTPTPNGNNQAGFPWTECVRNSGLAVTAMPVGTGAGQITVAESTQVTDGTVIETRFVWQDDSSWTNPQRLADLNLRAQQAVDDVLVQYGAKFRQFGRTVT